MHAALIAALIAALAPVNTPALAAEAELIALGRSLFLDVNLSARRTQSCATCHDPDHAFIDNRDNRSGGAASLGDDGVSLGDRNTPSISYAAQVPPFEQLSDGEYRGGLFHDGRANDLAEQAAEPLLNPIEMAMADRASVVDRVRHRPDYVRAFIKLFGATVFADTETAYSAVTQAIAAFERGPSFSTFDSRYDRYLNGTYELSEAEEQGRRLYFSDLTNCMGCHLLERNTIKRREPFSDQRYHNIGLPINHALRAQNGKGRAHRDRGLAENPRSGAENASGKFRTPSLRNVAVTAPYMHNGVFRKLETAIHFYNQYIVRNPHAAINPETGQAWGDPEIETDIALPLLREGQPLDEERIAALVAFLRALTDRRYEYLLGNH